MTVCPFSFLGHSRIYPIGVTVPERWNKGYRHSAREMASSGARDAFSKEHCTGKGLFLSGVCCIRCGQCSPFSGSLKNSVPERAFSGTEYARGAKNRLLWYAVHFRYGRDIRYRKSPPTVRGASSVRRLFDIAACGLNPLAQFRQSPLVNYRINSYICHKYC